MEVQPLHPKFDLKRQVKVWARLSAGVLSYHLDIHSSFIWLQTTPALDEL